MPKKELYQLARAFHKTRLWDQLSDSQLFAVQMPDGALGYVCVMGMRGDHLALAVYPGSAGLNAYRMLYGSLEETREIVRREIMMSQDCVMCSFENKDELSERERAEIRDLGLRFQGKQSYPMFKRYKPRRFPWFVEDPRDEEYLRLGLLAGLDVARRVEGRAVQQDLFHSPDPGVSKEALGFSQSPPFDREIPLLTPREDGTFAWGMTPLPAPSKSVYASPRLEDEMVLTKLKKLKQVGAWECGVFMHPEPTAEGDTDEDGFVTEPTCAPDFPLVLLMVERANGLVLHMGMTKQPEANLGELLDAFVEGMMKNGRPEEIFVEDERTFALLEGIAEQLGLRITLLEDLHLLEETEDELLRSIDEDEDSVEMLDSFLDEAQGIELPEAMRTMLENMLDRGALPDSVAEKARRLLEGKPSLPGTAPQALPVARKRAASVKGSYLFSVSLAKGCYRHIQISAAATLFDLHAAILDAFEFDDDHLHAFFMDNKVWSQAESYYSEYDDQADRHTSNYTLGEIGLSVGKHFKYLFDYGDEWRFQCKVLRVMREEVEEAEVVRSVGDAPEQYPALEEDDEDAEEPTFPELYSKDKIACLYAGLALPKETVEQLSAYFDAFANLYGIIPLREALKIFNRQNQPIQEADFEAFAEVARHEDRVFSILGEDDLYSDGNLASPMDREIIHEYLLFGDTEELEDLKSVQADKPYYVPSRRTLLRYADDHYFERTPEYTALRNYLRKETGLSAGKADAIAEELRLDAHMGERDMELILRELGRLGVKLENIGEVIPIVSLFYEMANHTRMHAHRGHTAKELFGENDTAPVITWGPGVVEAVRRGDLIPEAMRAQAQRMEFPSDEFRNNYLSELDRIEREARAGAPRTVATKIGRNAPCPCGSGKKYKHCCGKDV